MLINLIFHVEFGAEALARRAQSREKTMLIATIGAWRRPLDFLIQ
jgi:hypothetical protein